MNAFWWLLADGMWLPLQPPVIPLLSLLTKPIWAERLIEPHQCLETKRPPSPSCTGTALPDKVLQALFAGIPP